MATLQDAGRIALAEAMADMPIHIAIGRGDPGWGNLPPTEGTNEAGLVDEIGRRLVADVAWCLPDPAGDIQLESGERYTRSLTPTPYVHIRCPFDYTDAAGETIRELAVYLRSQTDPSLPAGQRWFTGAQVTAPGRMYLLSRFAPIPRTDGLRLVEEIVIPL